MKNINLAKLYHFDEMFDNSSKPHSCYKDYNKWLSCEEPRNLKKKQIEANKKKVGPVKKSRFQKKIEEMAKKRGIDPYSGRPKR